MLKYILMLIDKNRALQTEFKVAFYRVFLYLDMCINPYSFNLMYKDKNLD